MLTFVSQTKSSRHSPRRLKGRSPSFLTIFNSVISWLISREVNSLNSWMDVICSGVLCQRLAKPLGRGVGDPDRVGKDPCGLLIRACPSQDARDARQHYGGSR